LGCFNTVRTRNAKQSNQNPPSRICYDEERGHQNESQRPIDLDGQEIVRAIADWNDGGEKYESQEKPSDRS
jgi:hypothetical protein